MKRRYGKVGKTTLLAFALFSIILFLLEMETKKVVKAKDYAERLEAARLAESAFFLIREERIKRGIELDSINDPYLSGLIGRPSSPITIDHKSLDEVLLTTSPNFAGIILSLLKREGVRRGDTVLVTLDGSFPGLYFSFLAAVKVLGLNPFIFGFLTSAPWGANHPNFTYLDMEGILNSSHLLPFRTQYVLLGGFGLSPFARDLLSQAAERNGIPLLPEEKIPLYPKGKIFCLIGDLNATLLEKEIRKGKFKVLDLSQPSSLLKRLSIKREDLFQSPGKGKIYEEEVYSLFFAYLFTLLILIALFIIIRYDIEYYLLKKREKIEEEAI
ncbi:MAG: poly-gamma-glutamate system protein [candidate division WOR-3 bacterium]